MKAQLDQAQKRLVTLSNRIKGLEKKNNLDRDPKYLEAIQDVVELLQEERNEVLSAIDILNKQQLL